ncbi:MAG TPA: riboflavin synthase [Solirubrobacteraceae bacterium]
MRVFTGLVRELGTVEKLENAGQGVRLTVAASLTEELTEGGSVAVNGVCLTATGVRDHQFQADVMNETLARTALAGVSAGARVNLELPLRAGEPLGGHMVQGHVDGVGRVLETAEDGFARRARIEADPDLLRYVVVKGSITVDGVSLTVADVDDRSFTVSLIPETLKRTNLGAARDGASVNLEVDVLAKYVEKLVRR